MHWRHKMALERFKRAEKPLHYPAAGIGNATWNTLREKLWIVPRQDLAAAHETHWWQIPHEITDAGRVALHEAGGMKCTT